VSAVGVLEKGAAVERPSQNQSTPRRPPRRRDNAKVMLKSGIVGDLAWRTAGFSTHKAVRVLFFHILSRPVAHVTHGLCRLKQVR
jgi:hypothetical protein